ncbi:MAG: hypothetical protein ACRDPO_12255, partial [Streptosporangiaceae bacterium]
MTKYGGNTAAIRRIGRCSAKRGSGPAELCRCGPAGRAPGGRRLCQADGMTRAQLDRKPAEVSAMFDKVADRYDL